MQKKQLTPICIASPVRRSGTTLLQRLLCSSSNTLIYGESCANDFYMHSSMLSNKEMLFLQSKDWRNKQLDSVLEGNVNDWIPDLMPDIDGYINAYKDSFTSLANYYESFAQKQGRPLWGMKMPEWNPSGLLQIQRLFPATKIIYLHRNLEDCVRSAKGIEMIVSLNDIHQFSNTWSQFSQYALQHLKGANVMHINYEDLIENPGRWITQLESFTGASDIDKNIMASKINTYNDDPNIKPGDQSYLKPMELSKEELELMASFSRPKVDLNN